MIKYKENFKKYENEITGVFFIQRPIAEANRADWDSTSSLSFL